MVLNEVELGKMIGREAAELLDLSLRHVRRILAAYRKEGAAALAHGNRGRRPHNALDITTRRERSFWLMAKDPPSIQAPPYELPFPYHFSRKEDISIEFSRGHYHGVSTLFFYRFKL